MTKNNLEELAKKLESEIRKPKKTSKKKLKRRVIKKEEVKEVKEKIDITKDDWWKAIGDMTSTITFVPEDESERLPHPKNLTEEVFENTSPLTQATVKQDLGDVKGAYESSGSSSNYEKSSYLEDSQYKAEVSDFTKQMESFRDMEKTSSERLLEGNTVNPALASFAHQETPKYSQSKKKHQ
jgi:hypothetical protein